MNMKVTAKTIMIVEDEKAIREIYEIILKSAGYKILSAANGAEAIVGLSTIKPDLILLDLMMPVMDGVDTLKSIRASPETKSIPVIILTNIGASEVPSEIVDENVREILVKVELSPEQLLQKINKSLNS
jgi:CheY-like chemotaxis protein